MFRTIYTIQKEIRNNQLIHARLRLREALVATDFSRRDRRDRLLLRELQILFEEGVPQYGENPHNKPQKSKKELEKYPDRDIFRRWTFPGVGWDHLQREHYKLWRFVTHLASCHVADPGKNARTIQRYWRAYKNSSTVDPLRRMFLAYRNKKIETNQSIKLLLPWK